MPFALLFSVHVDGNTFDGSRVTCKRAGENTILRLAVSSTYKLYLYSVHLQNVPSLDWCRF